MLPTAAYTWYEQTNWATNLDVEFGGTHYTDWRLPIIFDQSCSGLNCTNSEMGYLYYTGLGNSAGSLTNTGDFLNLARSYYWSGTTSAPNENYAWIHTFNGGGQNGGFGKTNKYFAIAVRSGDVSVVPEPVSSTLFIIGGATLGFRRFRKKTRSI